ncbi:complex I intermediate-associated CIA30 domain containing protein [Nitzschia inconspicua]|uniref:Complex I intermediate-associated CIA30 domain containing protein n=1 Tax=Nitzschia inconspicua TaxID=303405 RepID=A0A9K3L6A0_9STRA|nr:complex I intermediate-associated CIA30 domain containing protein [Nitzschia inconspicua]
MTVLPRLLFVLLVLQLNAISAFSTQASQPWGRRIFHHHPCNNPQQRTFSSLPLNVMTTGDGTSSSVYESIFNFTDIQENAVSKFERIDDAIMGGISLSSIRQLEGEDFARWSGVCRTDGGGFCGTRTMPFEEPLKVGANVDGFYILCRFTSDDEPQRRVWKMTTRTESSRGEQLYQAMFEIPPSEKDDEMEWMQITIPFDSFAQVRGPRLVEGAPSLNVTGGLYQIGVTLSKFQIGTNVTELPNFRAGYFELQIKEIGVYNKEVLSTETETPLLETEVVKTLSLEEANKKRPILLKILSPVTNVLFSEKARRRQSANRILRKRGLSRWQIFKYAFQNRVERKGLTGAILESAKVAIQDSFRLLLGLTLRVLVFLPFVLTLRAIQLISGFLSKATKTKQA